VPRAGRGDRAHGVDAQLLGELAKNGRRLHGRGGEACFGHATTLSPHGVSDDRGGCRTVLGLPLGGDLREALVITARVVVGEDQPLVREGIVRVLEESGYEVVGTAGDATDLIRKARAHKPDVVITDIQMPPDSTDDGIRAAKTLRQELPDVGVLVLSQFLEARYALDLVGDNASGVGYLLKDRVGDLSIFLDAVRRVAAGGSALDPEVVQRMIGKQRHDSPLDDLTPREREVLSLMAQGRSNSGIADELVVTVSAIERHVSSIFSKLDLGGAPEDHRRVLAVLEYLRH
jgi:DNA-binding NarL/FixJ family response regulator